MKFAPFGIGAAIAVTVGEERAWACCSNLGVLVLHALRRAHRLRALRARCPIALVFKVPIRRFWQAVKEPWLIAFTTASSEAALPLAMQRMEQLGVPRRIVVFVLPTGYSFNLDGTTLYLALASVFVAQAAGIDMPIGDADPHDADAHAHEQRRGGGAARVARDPLRRARAVRPAARRASRSSSASTR